MGKINIVIPDDLELEFRRLVSVLYGLKKGNISKAVEEAIRMWIESKKDKIANYNLQIEHAYSIEATTTKDKKELPVFDLKDATLIFIGKKEPTLYSSQAFGTIWVEKGAVGVPLNSVERKLTEGRKAKICEEYECKISYKVIDDDNYVIIIPNVILGFNKDPEEVERKLKEWFVNNIPKLLTEIAP